MPTLFLVIYIILGLLLAGLGLPLTLRLVPPNRLYGFRTPRTLADPTTWYEANAYVGRLMLAAGIVTLVVSVGLYFVPSWTRCSMASSA